MKIVKNVIGDKQLAVPIIIGKDTVYIKTNIKQIDDYYTWDETQLTLIEYVEQISKTSLELQLAIIELYEQGVI